MSRDGLDYIATTATLRNSRSSCGGSRLPPTAVADNPGSQLASTGPAIVHGPLGLELADHDWGAEAQHAAWLWLFMD